jgi:hypothetical protein
MKFCGNVGRFDEIEEGQKVQKVQEVETTASFHGN